MDHGKSGIRLQMNQGAQPIVPKLTF